ncbi:hypothetical protein Btru_059561 [Bulinus truncatus]|nr:hypothetical protein Btru_059561 [Bulinus truncatus]
MAASVDDSNSATVEDDPVERLVVKCNLDQLNLEECLLNQQESLLQDSSAMTSHRTTDKTSSCVALNQNLNVQFDTISMESSKSNATDLLMSNHHQNLESENIIVMNFETKSSTVNVEQCRSDAENVCQNETTESHNVCQNETTESDNVCQNETTTRNTQDTEYCNENIISNGETEMDYSLKLGNSETSLDVHTNVILDSNKQSDTDMTQERPVREMLVRRKRSESTETSSENKPVLETLTFSAINEGSAGKIDCGRGEGDMGMCPCLLCDRSYPAYNKEDILAHLVLMHKFVIADVNYIANLPAYLRYWKKRMEEKPITEFCSKIVTNTGVKDAAPKEEFYLLCDALPEDKMLRENLQRKKLEAVLVQQQKEREETKFCRQCLFCKQTYCGNRAVLFDHLLRDHTFHMGQPDNLVFTDELFDLIQNKLDNQLCLFCEKSFKDKASLREHMRKKQHRKINPKNKEYDRFYIINYMEMGKNWESLQSEDNRLVKTADKASDEEDEWSGWEEESQSKVVCLFCDTSLSVQEELQKHMKDKHGFDLLEVNHKLQLNFYQKVKLINYIRRQVYHKTCYGCLETFSDKGSLNSHLESFPDHLRKVPDSSVWDQPQYFFPTYEDDTLLCQLDDDDDGASGDALGVTVIAEDIPVSDTILSDQKLRKDLFKA